MDFLDSNLFQWVLLPLLIFTARIVDVSMQTVRIVFVSRGHRVLAPLIGFFEVMIWLAAIGQIMRNLDNVLCYVAYGGGFAAGTWIGMLLEEKLAIGTCLVRVITQRDATALIAALRAADYGVTHIPAEGMKGKVSIVYTVIRRNCLPDVVRIIEEFNPRAFYTIETVRSVREGVFPLQHPTELPLGSLRRLRKGK
ncbi:MAG: DUF2179 domain-containing protein [Candidatus Krumholzibacteria bacterium]|nr:DUF2179 domain-containing protein [Candidatus Krumholzibacteria bacterium]